MQILSNLIYALNVRKAPKFLRLTGNRGRGTGWWRQSGSGNTAVSCMRNASGPGTVRSLWTWLWGRYHVPRNVFLAFNSNSYYFGETLSQISRRLLSVTTSNSAAAEKCQTWNYSVWVMLQELTYLKSSLLDLHIFVLSPCSLWTWNKSTELSWMAIKHLQSSNWND